MKTIRLAESPFYTLQGEGRYVGVPSVFVRTFGCNFRCPKFGRNRDEVLDGINPDVQRIIDNIDQYKKLEDLPLVETGCDTYVAIYPQFKRFTTDYSLEQLVSEISVLLPFSFWQGEHLVITGGEPLLGWQKFYPRMLTWLMHTGLKHVTFETNGTQPLTEELSSFLLSNQSDLEVTFSVSAKLTSSGQASSDAIIPSVVNSYQDHGFTYLKLVVATDEDLDEAIEVLDIYRAMGFAGPTYLMPVGGTPDSYQLNERRVADFALKYGVRFSPRLQVPLFSNSWGT